MGFVWYKNYNLFSETNAKILYFLHKMTWKIPYFCTNSNYKLVTQLLFMLG